MEQGSVTGAASKLGVTSMVVSNNLNRLRSVLLALAPGMLRLEPPAPFASAKLPFNTPSVFMSMLWHKRYERDPAHQWLRFQLEDAANQLVQRLKTVK